MSESKLKLAAEQFVAAKRYCHTVMPIEHGDHKGSTLCGEKDFSGEIAQCDNCGGTGDSAAAPAASMEGWQLVPKDHDVEPAVFGCMELAIRQAMTDPSFNSAEDIDAATRWKGNATNLVRKIIAAATMRQQRFPNSFPAHQPPAQDGDVPIASKRLGCSRCGAHYWNLSACSFGHKDCAHFRAPAQDGGEVPMPTKEQILQIRDEQLAKAHFESNELWLVEFARAILRAYGDARAAAALASAGKPSGQDAPDWEGFALAILTHAREFAGCDVDGGFVQDMAAKFGLLVEREVTESCGENCACAEVGDFPQNCFFNSAGVDAAIATKEAGK